MKKALQLLVLICLFTNKSFAQEIVKPQKNTNKPIVKNYLNSEDSTLAKTINGFDVKKSKIDNMVYLYVNKNNPSLNKMPAAINNLPVEPMPIARLATRNEQLGKERSLSFKITIDSLKRGKGN